LGELVSRWRLQRCAGRAADFLEEPSKPNGGDHQLDRRLAGHIAVGVWGAARYVYVTTGVDVTPLQSLIIFDQHLLRTGKEEEVLGVVVAVHRHRHPGRDHTPHDAEVRVGTRATILATATRLFLAHGYGRVTVNDIAQEAHLAVPTVYASTGGKSAILSTLIEEGM
jgi:Bacterial regulatory proteins, tetR family